MSVELQHLLSATLSVALALADVWVICGMIAMHPCYIYGRLRAAAWWRNLW